MITILYTTLLIAVAIFTWGIVRLYKLSRQNKPEYRNPFGWKANNMEVTDLFPY